MNMAWVVEIHPTFLGCPVNVPNGGDPNIIQMLSSSLGKPMGWGSPVSFEDPGCRFRNQLLTSDGA